MNSRRAHFSTWILTPGIAACLALLVWAGGCSGGERDHITITSNCTKTSECRAGQGCLKGKCVDLPCDGKCTTEQACINDACVSAQNLDCSADPARCPSAFTCSNGRCKRSCTIDQDCPEPATCNVDLFICAECALDRDCTDPSRPHCDQSQGSCVGCLDSSDCRDSAGRPLGKYCEQTTQTCEPGCRNILDCPVGTKSCLGASETIVGKCAECTANNDCTSQDRSQCDPASNACVECLDNSQCRSNACDTQKKVCVECVDDLVCGRGSICNPNTFKCEIGCSGGSGSAQCPPEVPVCDASRGNFGQCVRCNTNADCPRAQVCDRTGATPACVPGCDGDGKCAPDEDPTVVTTICDPTKGSKGACVQCRSDANCPTGQLCDTGTGMCRCKKAGEACSDSSECGYQEVQGPNGVVVNCNALNSFCITNVKCSVSGERSVPTVCSTAVKGAGLPDRNPPDTTGCPAGFSVERAKDAGASTYTVVCVPKKAPYTCY